MTAPERVWITGQGWRTVHLQRGNGHPVDLPRGRWTECGRLVRVPLPRLWDDERECGQCLRRAHAVDLGGGL